MISVIAVITAKPGQRDTVLGHFRANVPAVLAEEGCIEYGAHVDTEGMGGIQTKFGPDTFVVLEKWASVGRAEGALGGAAHGSVRGRTRELLASRVIHVVSPT